MPQKKNPESLQDLSLASITNFIANTGVYIARTICADHKIRNDTLKRKLSRKFKGHSKFVPLKKQEFKVFKNKSEFLLWIKTALSLVPHIFADKITRDLLVIGDKLYHSHMNIDPIAIHVCHEWIENFVKAIIHTSVKVLYFQGLSERIQELACTQFKHIQRLHVLNLPPMNRHSVCVVVEREILHLKYLLSFTFNWDCSDEVLHQLSIHCKSLQSLDVSCSSLVTQKSIPHVHKLQSLRYLDVNKTTLLAEDSLVELITGLPHLQTLHAQDAFITHTHHVLPALRSLSAIAAISAIPKTFPNLVRLSICPDSYTDDISVLGVLQTLQHLELHNCSFEESNVDGLLQDCGNRLHTLKLNDVDNVDALAIGMFCVNLCELAYNYCTFNVMIGGLPEIPCSLILTRLSLKTYRKDTFFRYLPILDYINLYELHVEGIQSFNTDFIYQVVSRNTWKYLRCLHIGNCGDITPECIICLLENCENLSTLSGIINDSRYNQIKDFIVKNNFNINLL